MTRKVEIELTVRLLLTADEGVEASEVVDTLDYDFRDTTTRADVEDMEILDYEVKDSR